MKVLVKVSNWVIGWPRLLKKVASWVVNDCSIFDSWSFKDFSSASFIIELLLVKSGSSEITVISASEVLLNLGAETVIEEFGFGGSSSIERPKRVKFA